MDQERHIGTATILSRRRLLQLTLCTVAGLAAQPPCWAQAYPSRALRWIVGFPAGGAADIVSRIMAAWLSERIEQPVVVENRPGAGGNIATQTMLSAPPDGHTLLLIGSSTIVNAMLNEGRQSSSLQEIIPVSGLTMSAYVILTNPASPGAGLTDLIAFARSKPGALRVGTYGIGTQSHIAFELFRRHAGLDVTHVPYRGGALMVSDLLGRHIDVGFDTTASALPHVKVGTLRALAVTTAGRLKGALPDVPAVAETLPGYEAVVRTGIGVRRGTATEIVERLSLEINSGLADPAIRARIEDLGITPTVYSPETFAVMWEQEKASSFRLVQDMIINQK